MMVDNEPRATLPGEISPGPLHKNAHPQARLGQELKVNFRPREPGHEPRQLNGELPTLQYCETFADDGQVAFIGK